MNHRILSASLSASIPVAVGFEAGEAWGLGLAPAAAWGGWVIGKACMERLRRAQGVSGANADRVGVRGRAYATLALCAVAALSCVAIEAAAAWASQPAAMALVGGMLAAVALDRKGFAPATMEALARAPETASGHSRMSNLKRSTRGGEGI